MSELHVVERMETGKAAKGLLKTGKMPAVVYGPKQHATSIVVESHAFAKLLREAGESSVVDLVGLAHPLQVLIQDIDRDPVTNVPRHADFYAIEKGAKVEVAVPLNFVGESLAVKTGANLVKVLHEVTIEAGAADIPHDLVVDITALSAVGDQIHVRDLALPKGVTLVTDGDEVIALAQEVEVEAEEPTAAPDMGAIEVEKKGKEEEGADTDAS